MKTKLRPNAPLAIVLIAFALAVGSVSITVPLARAADSITATSTSMTGGGGSVGGPSAPQNAFFLQNPLSPSFSTVGGLVDGVMVIVAYVAVLVGVIMLIWTGVQFVLAQGKPERLRELKRQMLWIAIGLALVIGARIIVGIVINTLEASKAVNQPVLDSAKNALNATSL